MRTVIQRVSKASVTIDKNVRSEISSGLLVLVGIEEADTNADIEWLSNKIVQLRIFSDNNDIMNYSVMDTGGDILAVSQFTLYAKTRKGNRPSYIQAAHPDKAIPIYNNFIDRLSQLLGKRVKTGEFGAKMKIDLINEGPVTIFIDTKNKE
jgi:D-aminoacyl-tRNA deacylase